MAEKYTFKEEYYTNTGLGIIENGYNVRYYSNVVRGGAGTKDNPISSKSINQVILGNIVLVFADGYHKLVSFRSGGSYDQDGTVNHFIGNDTFRTTYLDGNISIGSYTYTNSIHYFKNLTLDVNVSSSNPGGSSNSLTLNIQQCDIRRLNIKSGTVSVGNVSQSIVRTNTSYAGSRNSYIGVAPFDLYNNNLSLVDKCDVNISQPILDSYVDLYYAFNDCNFKIGSEEDYTPLNGNTEEELRADFVARCTAQGINCPSKSEYGETLAMYRWVFAKNAATDGVVLKNSVIHAFEKRRFIYFGYTGKRDGISINTAVNIPSSISQGNPHTNNLIIADNAVKLVSGIDVAKKYSETVQSNICWMGGMKNITGMEVIHNFEKKYGVDVDSSPNVEDRPTVSGQLVAGEYYVVRSTDDNVATVIYNGNNYTSSLADRNNIFLATSATTFIDISGNSEVYRLIDKIQYRHINMRVVNKIPGEIIKSGNLLAGYWYLVEHDADQSNTTDYVTYKGVNYPAVSSFLVTSDNLTFAISGNIHLRRCWKDDFDLNTETKDKAFWQNEQKPKWFKVINSDTRCLMKNNSSSENEIATDSAGNYITSGHPYFYKVISGESGVKLPAFPIKGCYYQIQLNINTLNPM